MDTSRVQSDFPILQQKIHGKRLVYLDNAATSQKPKHVLEAITNFYSQKNANVHRGAHSLGDASTLALEKARATIARFFNAQPDNLILTHNTTHAINGVAYGWADHSLKAGDVILTTLMEHHANLVTWQEVTKRTGAELQFVGLDDSGRLNLEDLYKKLKNTSVKLVSLVHVSNTLGVINPVEEIVQKARELAPQAKVLLDGAQAVSHLKVDVAKIGADFYVFSGHKMLGPMGIGGILVDPKLHKSGELKPWMFGGGMIDSVTLEATEFHPELSERFTAGTPDVASAVGLAAACEYLSELGLEAVEKHDRELVAYTLHQLAEIPQVTIVGPTAPKERSQELDRVGSVAFLYEGVHPHDVAQILDSEGVAVRSGHHCCMPLHTHFGWVGTTRASFHVYNTKEDVDVLLEALKKVEQVFSK